MSANPAFLLRAATLKPGGREALFAKTDFLYQGNEPGVRAQAIVDGISVEQGEIGITLGIGLLQPGECLLGFVKADGDPRKGQGLT